MSAQPGLAAIARLLIQVPSLHVSMGIAIVAGANTVAITLAHPTSRGVRATPALEPVS